MQHIQKGFASDIESIAESGVVKQDDKDDITQVIEQRPAFIETGVDNHYKAGKTLFSPIDDTLRQAYNNSKMNNTPNFQKAVGVVDTSKSNGNSNGIQGTVPIKPIMHKLVYSEIQNTLRRIEQDIVEFPRVTRKDILSAYINSIVEKPSLFCRVTTCKDGIGSTQVRQTLAGTTEAQLAATNVTDISYENEGKPKKAKIEETGGQLITAIAPELHDKNYATKKKDEKSRCCICGYPLYGLIEIEHIVSSQLLVLMGINPKLHLQKDKGGGDHWLQRVCDKLQPLNNSYANTVRSLMLPSHKKCNGVYKSEHSPFFINDNGLISMSDKSWGIYAKQVINDSIAYQQTQFASTIIATPPLTTATDIEQHKTKWLEIQRNQFEDIVAFLNQIMVSEKQNCFSMIKKMLPSLDSDKNDYIKFLRQIVGIKDPSVFTDDIIDNLLSDENEKVITDFMYITNLKVYLRLAHASSTIGGRDTTGSEPFTHVSSSEDDSETGAGVTATSGTAMVIQNKATTTPPRNISRINKEQVSALKGSPGSPTRLDNIQEQDSQTTYLSALTQSPIKSQQGEHKSGGRKTKKRIRKTKKRKMNKKSKTRRRK